MSLTLSYNCHVGGDTKIKNNEKRTPYDLAKNPECGRLLRGAIGNNINFISRFHFKFSVHGRINSN